MTSVTEIAPVPASRTTEGKPRRTWRPRGGLLLGLAAWLFGIMFVLPVLWMTLTSFHSEADAATNPPSFAAPLTLQGYREFFGASSGASPWPPLLNSVTASVVSTALVLLLAIPAAYALSIRPVRKWTDVLFFFLSTKMLPVVAGLLPIYLFAQASGLLDNIWLLIVLYTSMNLPIAVWMMRSFLADLLHLLLERTALRQGSHGHRRPDCAGVPHRFRDQPRTVPREGVRRRPRGVPACDHRRVRGPGQARPRPLPRRGQVALCPMNEIMRSYR
jgi:sorbitol/mannitol transport system permease protein